MTARRVLLLTHGPLREREGRFVGKERDTENDVRGALARLGHEVEVLALEDSLDPAEGESVIRELRAACGFA